MYLSFWSGTAACKNDLVSESKYRFAFYFRRDINLASEERFVLARPIQDSARLCIFVSDYIRNKQVEQLTLPIRHSCVP